MPDLETIRYVGTIGGIGAVFGLIVLAAGIWFLREFLKNTRAEEGYRRERDERFLVTLTTIIATMTELKNSVDKSIEVDRIVERLQARNANTKSE